jgi:hypothetical protein
MHASHERTQEVAALLDVVVEHLLALVEPCAPLLSSPDMCEVVSGRWSGGEERTQLLPKVMVPRQRGDTRRPDAPSSRYSSSCASLSATLSSLLLLVSAMFHLGCVRVLREVGGWSVMLWQAQRRCVSDTTQTRGELLYCA